jgi:hypothetical protein
MLILIEIINIIAMKLDFLLPGEKIIYKGANDNLILTNFRVRYHDPRFAKKGTTSITLDKISAVQMVYKTYPIYLIIPILTLLLARFISRFIEVDFMSIMIILFVSIILFIITRKLLIVITSDGGTKIEFFLKY